MSLLYDLFLPISKGGWVSWSLFVLAGVLWYSIGYRYFSLKKFSGNTSLAPETLNAFKQPIQSIVVVAPLLGLLGTVIGMIETFSSLQDQAMHSQGGGIAAGISQALITTQMGLMVAIPGLLIGRQLDKKQDSLEEDFQVSVAGGTL